MQGEGRLFKSLERSLIICELSRRWCSSGYFDMALANVVLRLWPIAQELYYPEMMLRSRFCSMLPVPHAGFGYTDNLGNLSLSQSKIEPSFPKVIT